LTCQLKIMLICFELAILYGFAVQLVVNML